MEQEEFKYVGIFFLGGGVCFVVRLLNELPVA